MDILRNKRGSTTVLTAVIIGTVLMLIISLLGLTKMKTEKGKIQSTLSIGARSILSEYNPYLKDRYGIFAVSKEYKEIEKDIKFYIGSNLKANKANNIEKVSINNGTFRLDNINIFENEILDYMKISAMGILDKNEKRKRNDRKGERILRNGKIKKMLPSKGKESIAGSVNGMKEIIGSIDKIFDKTKKNVIIDEYTMKKFNNYVNDSGNTFFKNEIEYILCGGVNDKKNKDKVHRKLLAVRNLINLGIIQADSVLRSEAMAAAATGGVFSPAVYLALVEAWALAEATNDMKILENGGKLPVVKNNKNWMISINNIHKIFKESYVDNGCKKGMTYNDYLRVLLFFMSKEVKLKRMMDLIQINVQGNHNGEFSFSGAFAGIEGSIVIDGKKYWFNEKY